MEHGPYVGWISVAVPTPPNPSSRELAMSAAERAELASWDGFGIAAMLRSRAVSVSSDA